MVGQAECHSALLRFFETKAWKTEKSTIKAVRDNFLNRKTSLESTVFHDKGPFTKSLLKRAGEKIGPYFKTTVCKKTTLGAFAKTLNRLTYDASQLIFGQTYDDLPTEEHQLFVIEHLDLSPEDVQQFLSNHAYHIIRRIQGELIKPRQASDIESDLSKHEFSNSADFCLHLYSFKKLYDKMKADSILLNSLRIKESYIDYVEANEFIHKALESEAQSLTIKTKQSRSNLLVLPPEIGYLTGLTALYLDGNRLAYLPLQIGSLTQLRQLNLRGNGLTHLPSTFQNLTSLTQLSLRQNLLTTLPDEFENLTNLRLLDLSANHLPTVPHVINRLGSLSKLSLSGNPLISVSLQASSLLELTYLGLKYVSITLIEDRELHIFRERNCKVHGAHVLSLLEALPQHLLLLLMTFLPWQELHHLAGLNRYLNRYAKSLIERRNLISQHVFGSRFADIEEGEKDFLTQHLSLTQIEISFKITYILQEIERICLRIQDDIINYVKQDDDGNEIKQYVYSTQDVREWLSYDFFDSQDAFLDHLSRFVRLVRDINKMIQPNDQHVSLERAFHSYECCLDDLSQSKQNSKRFSFVNSALVLIPPELSKFRHLEKITLIELYLTSLPDSLKDLPHLTHIYLNKNLFAEIPKVLYACLQLKTIALIENCITLISDKIANLQSLEMLALHKNNIQTVPDALSRLSHLKSLILTENPICALPDSMTKLTSLRDLRVSLTWSALSAKQKLWLLRQTHQKMKTAGIPAPAYLSQIPAILESIQLSLQETSGFEPLDQIEARFSPDSFDGDLGAFLDYLRQFADSVVRSNEAIPLRKKHQINPTELSFSYKGYSVCVKMIEDSVRQKDPSFTLNRTFNTGQTLTLLPLNIRELRHVKYLNLQRNRLTYIHEEIWRLPLLETLKLDYNQLSKLPGGINQSRRLRVLSLSHNPLCELPGGIENTRLKRLKLCQTNIDVQLIPENQKQWLQKSIKRGITIGVSFNK